MTRPGSNRGGKDWAEFSRTREKTRRARLLRREATPAERILWAKLSLSQLEGLKFRRQHPVGPYVLDLYCAEIGLCIELDGEQHAYDREVVRDAARTAYLDRCSIEVMRFWNQEVKENLVGVLNAIYVRATELQRTKEFETMTPVPHAGED